MLKLIGLLAALILALPAQAKRTKTVNVLLTSRNTVVLRGPVTYDSVAQVQQKLLFLSLINEKNTPLYLFLDTPGGSVSAGMELIGTAKSLPQKVHTITNFAASMGYITVQNLDNRYILANGTLMSHRATVGLRGQIPGELNTRVKFIGDTITEIETVVSKRLGLSHSTYRKLIKDEYWVYGKKSVEENSADAIANVRCGKSLAGTTKEKVMTFFGPVILTMSRCPLVSAPLDISFARTKTKQLTLKEELNFKNYIKKAFTDQREFVEEFIAPNKPLEYLK